MDQFRHIFAEDILPYNGRATLAGKVTTVKIESVLSIPLSLVSLSGHAYRIDVRLMVMDDLGEDAIIGLPVIVIYLLPLFVEAIKHAAEFLMVDWQESDFNEIIERPWTVMDEGAVEDEETPLPCAFTGPLQFLMMSREEALDKSRMTATSPSSNQASRGVGGLLGYYRI